MNLQGWRAALFIILALAGCVQVATEQAGPLRHNTEYPRDRGVMAEMEAVARRGMGTGRGSRIAVGLCHKFPQGCWHQQRDMGPAARSTSRTGLALDPFRDTVAKTPLR